MKKRGPRQGHIELLEQRLKKMEELMTAGSTITNATTDSSSINSADGSLPPILSNAAPQLGYQVIPQTTMPSCYTPPTLLPPMPTTPLTNELPSDDIMEHLTNLFFRNCATISPVIDVVGFKKSIRDRTCNQFLLYTIMAVAARSVMSNFILYERILD